MLTTILELLPTLPVSTVIQGLACMCKKLKQVLRYVQSNTEQSNTEHCEFNLFTVAFTRTQQSIYLTFVRMEKDSY